MTDRPFARPQSHFHPFLQLLVLIGVFVLALFVGTAIGMGICWAFYGLTSVTDVMQLKFSSPNSVNVLWILQLTGTTLPLLATPLIFSFFVVNQPREYLKTSFRLPWGLLLLVLAIMFVSDPAIEFLSNLNEKMVLPHWLHWMRDSEDNAEKLIGIMLQMKTIWALLFNVIFIALLTAIVEEFMFRGVLQTIFVRWTGNVHVAVWVTAILFSAFHMEFFGFLPRMLLGALFGYFVAWSGSIWPAVWAHFLNNGTAVVAEYLYQHKAVKTNPDSTHLFSPLGCLFSFVIMVSLMLIYRRIATEKTQPALEN